MEIEITPENVEKKFANAVDYYCIYMPNILNFYQLFTRRVNNKIASMRICVKRDVTPVLEYNEKWVCEIDPALFNQALAIDLYRFINHHCTLRELQGANAFKASTAVCNSPELQQFLKAAPLELAEMARKLIWSREIIEEEIGEKISDEDWYYESVFEILNRKSPQQQQQNQNHDDNQSGSGQEQEQQSGSSDDDKKDENQNGSGKNDKKDQDDKSKGSSKKDKDGEEGDKDSDSDQQNGDGDGDEEDQDQNSNGKDGKDKDSKGKDEDQDQEGDGKGDKDQKSDGKDGKDDQNEQNSQNGGKDGQEGDEEDDSDEQDGEGDSDSKDGQNGKDGDSDQQDGNGGKSPRDQELDDNANADPSKAPNSTGNPFKDWSSNGEENTEEWGRNQVVDQLIQEAFEHSKSTGWGSLTGAQISQIEIANRRKISITPIIASFAASVRTRKRFATRMRYNKRYGLIFPGYRLDRKSRILFAIDSSGSMSDEDINKGCAILHNFLKKCDIDVAFWDAQMIDPFKFKKNITKIDAPGRGGTDPHCVGEYLDEHKKLHYDGVILFTDCIWSWKENNLDVPVFIISSEEKYRVPSFVKHHTTIQALTHCFD